MINQIFYKIIFEDLLALIINTLECKMEKKIIPIFFIPLCISKNYRFNFLKNNRVSSIV